MQARCLRSRKRIIAENNYDQASANSGFGIGIYRTIGAGEQLPTLMLAHGKGEQRFQDE
jgi:hypothetical protein